MRHYPVNSPRASARVVALAANSQGRLSRDQMEAVRRLRLVEQLGLEPHVWHEVLTCMYADLLPLQQRTWSAVFREDSAQMETVLAEIEDAQLRYKIFSLSTALAELEGHPAPLQNPVLDAVEQRWREPADGLKAAQSVDG